MGSFYEPRCKVCNSMFRKEYEKMYRQAKGNISWQELARKAEQLGENISWKAFSRHFSKHFTSEVMDFISQEEDIEEYVEEAKKEAVDLVQEIKSNLKGLKSLLDTVLPQLGKKGLSPSMLRALTDVYREHRQTLESCEKLSSKLLSQISLSETELLRILYFFGKDLCPDCLIKFKNNLDEYLRRKKIGA